MPLRRGFKTEAGRLAKDIWDAMGLTHSCCIIDVIDLAKHVGCMIYPADALVGIAKLKQLRRIQDDAFFSCTFELPSHRRAIVYNPLMPDTRRNSDVAHEVAHIILEHRLSRLKRLGSIAFLSCDTQQEDEAAWLSGCLLLPRAALVHDLREQKTPAMIAKTRGVSHDMVDYRLRVTGLTRQLGAGRSRHATSPLS